MKQNEITVGRFLRIVLIVVGVGVAFVVLDSLSSVLLPFAIAWLLAYLLNPLVNIVQNRMRVKYRALSIVVALLMLGLVIYGVIEFILPLMFSELYALKGITVSFFDQNINDGSIPEPIMNLFKGISDEYGFTEKLQNSSDAGLFDILASDAQEALLGTGNVGGQMLSSSIILLYMFFILLDFERVSRGWQPYVPKKWRGVVLKLWNDMVYGMNQYFRGQALVALCVGILFSLGFLIIDFPAAIAFGLFIGVLNLVPYLQVISLLPMAMLAMLKAANTGEEFWPIMLLALVVMLVVQLIQDLILVPKIMGKRMNLHPAIILLSLSIWGHWLGVLGMIVALPLTTLLLAYIRRYNEIAEISSHSEEIILKEAIGSTHINKGEVADADVDNEKKGDEVAE